MSLLRDIVQVFKIIIIIIKRCYSVILAGAAEIIHCSFKLTKHNKKSTPNNPKRLMISKNWYGKSMLCEVLLLFQGHPARPSQCDCRLSMRSLSVHYSIGQRRCQDLKFISQNAQRGASEQSDVCSL